MDKTKMNSSTKKMSLPSSLKLKGAKAFFPSKNELRVVGFSICAFLIGRILVFQFMSPALIPFLSCFLGAGQPYMLIVVAAFFGLASQLGRVAFLEYAVAMALLTAAQLIFFQHRRTTASSVKGLLTSACILTGGLISAATNGMSTYFTVVAAIEAVVAYTLAQVFDIAVSYINDQRRPLMGNSVFISLAIFSGLCFIGMADIAIKGVLLRDLLAITLVLMLGYCAGAPHGAAGGLLIGLLMTFGGSQSPAIVGVFGIGGLMAGVFRNLGKPGTVSGFLGGEIITFLYLNSVIMDKSLLFTSGLAAAMFLLIPAKTLDRIKNATGMTDTHPQANYTERITNLAGNKLMNASKSFMLLSKIFDDQNQTKEADPQKAVTKLVDHLAEDVCKHCMRFENCWKENFYNTYQSVFSLLATCEQEGQIDMRSVPPDFYNNCMNVKNIVSSANALFNQVENDKKWLSKIAESRELVFEQLMGVSNTLGTLSKEFQDDMVFETDLEKDIQNALSINRIAVTQVTVLKNKDKRYEVMVTVHHCGFKNRCTKDIAKIISGAIGHKMEMTGNGCQNLSGQSNCHLHYVEAVRFQITVGTASAAKGGAAVSGDNFTTMPLPDGKYLMALSDGMGTGGNAQKESMAAIEILEQFMASGFDMDMAIRMINSALVLRSDEEIFSTLDLLHIDLYTGYAEAVKSGAVETFLLRGTDMRILRSTSLPVGILSQVDYESLTLRLKDGDIIIMVSDGITDAKDYENGCQWIADTIKKADSVNPQDIATYVLNEAKISKNGSPTDDMTVLAARFWERA